MRIARIALAVVLFAATIWVLTLERPEPVQDWRAEFARDTEPGELRLLFVGNSFTERNDLPRMVAELMRTQPDVTQVRSHIVAEFIGLVASFENEAAGSAHDLSASLHKPYLTGLRKRQ